MSRDSNLKTIILFTALVLGGVAGAAAGAEPGKVPATDGGGRVIAGESVLPIDRTARVKGQTIIRCRNPFRITIPRSGIPRSTSGVSEILLQMFSPEKGKWVGYGLMDLKRERVRGGDVRTVGASIDFVAPAEGIYCLRSVARNRAGKFEEKPRDLTNVQWVVVLDRTKPKVNVDVEVISPDSDEGKLTRGSRLVIKWGQKSKEAYPAKRIRVRDEKGRKYKLVGSNRVWVSHDDGTSWEQIGHAQAPGTLEWEVEGPNTDALRVRVTVQDAAGNVGAAEWRAGQKVSGFESSKLPKKTTAARRTYQRGVIYMTRGEYPRAAEEFKEAIRLDKKLMQAYLDLSAAHLHRFEKERLSGKEYARRHLQDAQLTCEAAIGFFGDDVSLRYNLALVYRHQADVYKEAGKLEKAAESLQKGLKRKPRHIASIFALASIRYEQARPADARKLWRQVAALGGSKHPLARRAVRCLNKLAKEAAKRKPRPTAVSVAPPGLQPTVQ